MTNQLPVILYPGISIGQLQLYAIEKLGDQYGRDEAVQLVKTLLVFYTGLERYQLISQAEAPVREEIYPQLTRAIHDLMSGRPLQYILNSTEFYGLDLAVNSSVLIPRPETEELVDWILNDQHNALQRESELKILDAGTGSGAIALALKSCFPEANVSALDISEAALETAGINAASTKLSVNFILADLLANDVEHLPRNLDILVSNPPYILEAEKMLMRENVLGHEPHLALFVPDADPMKFYRPLAAMAMKLLRPGGLLYLEINENKGDLTRQTLEAAGLVKIESRIDMQGKMRMMRAERAAGE